MKIEILSSKKQAKASAFRRIIVSRNTIEFLDQSMILEEDEARAKKTKGYNLDETAFRYSNALAEVWDTVMNVPLEPDVPADLGNADSLEEVPEIKWSDDPPVVVPHDKPTIAITIGQAVIALAMLGDSMRPPAPPA